MKQHGRIYFLDNLRAVVILLVVVLHGSMTYMTGAPPWWYVVDSQNSLFFTLLVLLIDIPIMQIMFFAAGYFALPSLRKRSSAAFLKDKFFRIGAPWLFGALFLAPPTAYLIYYSRAVPMSFVQFWGSDFWTVLYQQSVYWFLGVLFLLFFLLVIASDVSERLRTAQQRISKPTWKLFVGFGSLMSLGMFIMNQFFPIDAWYSRSYILVFQPLRVPLYVGYFALGIYAHLRGWFLEGGYKPRLLPWAVVWLAAGLLYLANRLFFMTSTSAPTLAIQVTHAVLFNAFCLASLLAGAALFQRKVGVNTLFWDRLSANSYGIYYIHPLILYPLTYIFLTVSLPLFVKAPVVIGLAILLSWAVSALVLTRAPVVRRAFG